MDETIATALSQLRLAFKSLSKSVEKALMTEMYPNSGDLSARSYRALHTHAVTLIPDDYYVREVLALDVADDAPEKQTVVLLETPNEEGPWSAKPMAEHPVVAVAPVILNALRNATGVEFTSLPVTPARILEALKNGKEVL